MKLGDKVPPTMHLYRGSPSVRSWSKYQETVEAWTLCGISRYEGRKLRQQPAHATEDASQVSCAFCLDLMRPTKKELAAEAAR